MDINKTTPKISIITASYNYAKYITKTIESIINQTYQNWELIIVDDGSKDNSVEIIKSYCEKDSRIKLYQHKNGINKGLKDTLLLGIKNSTSDWIAFCESDDYYLPNHLEEKVKIINKNNDVNLIFNDFLLEGNMVFKNSQYYKKCKTFLDNRIGNHSFKDVCCEINPIATFSIVLLRKKLLKGLDFNCPEKPLLDYYLWAQLSKKTHFYYLNEPLSVLYRHQDSYISKRNESILLFILKISLFLPKIFTKRFKMTLLLIKMKLLLII